MTGTMPSSSPRTVAVIGGSGFLGRFVVAALARRGYRVRVGVRRPDLAGYLLPLGNVGQVQMVQTNLRDRDSIANTVANVDAVVNLVGILEESGKQKFSTLQAEGPRLIADVADKQSRLIHVSAIGADKNSESVYGRTKAQGEENLFAARPDAIVMRPSVIFGNGDGFFNKLGWIVRLFPVLPVPGLETRLQPVFADDVAEAVARAVDGDVQAGRIYELGGPHVKTLRELIGFVLSVTERKRIVFNQSMGMANANAALMECLDKLTLGLIPDELVVTRDQLKLLKHDNVVSQGAIHEGRTLEGIGIMAPQSYEGIVPSYLIRFRKTGQFDLTRRRAAKN